MNLNRFVCCLSFNFFVPEQNRLIQTFSTNSHFPAADRLRPHCNSIYTISLFFYNAASFALLFLPQSISDRVSKSSLKLYRTYRFSLLSCWANENIQHTHT